ncbi:glutaredoxin family protein [Ornithinicoccus hortensis]|uniref:Glutaredoxin-like protein n=1 Tax=Ornithinicoccus hortensis TaxID=82346 RepID=A0A542YV16_9MICO|nr:glutaredoxin domain-containing protein [Ornithinicoccus hortensis]TQL51929.1 glutaredoxin-like protein [Ornithinicoccus hortensis]
MRWLWFPMLALFTYLAGEAAWEGRWALAAVYVTVGGGLSYWLSPWQGGRSVRHEEVQAMPEQERQVVIYWRPGCPYCMQLKSALDGLRDKAHWVNIWQDDAAAEFVRSVNDGNETVPTVVIDGEPHTNPDPGMVRARLDAMA